MKVLLGFIFVFLFAPSTILLSQDATKEETVAWLKSRLDYYPDWSEDFWEELKVVKYDFVNDTLFYKTSQKDLEGGYALFAIPIRDINPDRIKISRMIGTDSELVIEMYTNYGKESVIFHSIQNGEVFVKFGQNRANFYFPESVIKRQGTDVTERAVKALKYLIKLSGGEKEKF